LGNSGEHTALADRPAVDPAVVNDDHLSRYGRDSPSDDRHDREQSDQRCRGHTSRPGSVQVDPAVLGACQAPVPVGHPGRFRGSRVLRCLPAGLLRLRPQSEQGSEAEPGPAQFMTPSCAARRRQRDKSTGSLRRCLSGSPSSIDERLAPQAGGFPPAATSGRGLHSLTGDMAGIGGAREAHRP
jgi:hypothetical protein